MDRTAFGETVELGYDTARIRMPLVASAYNFRHLTTLHIKDVGMARVRLEDLQDRDAEVSFVNATALRPKLTQLIAAQNPMRNIRPIGN
ncbi:hypothetical protein ATO6_17415 [Oceanicola sp. 22II-s10i]|uniref:hypothetical protein n=1 Tax=Oceanicola sp. 22II-s10i TaxID=1317116 RepID=UPI000B5228F4|nr:hypothetical protein [Oceanicola sp. 22II-s10i]OWU83640.1 hypothetical protein ATO6_17415 [Oceanicola sp. 22II-s10i]